MCLTKRFLVEERVGSRWVTRGKARLMQATDCVAGEEMRAEREFVDPRQDNVLSGLGDEDPEHRQDTGHPQLDCRHGRLEEQTFGFKSNIYVWQLLEAFWRILYEVIIRSRCHLHTRWQSANPPVWRNRSIRKGSKLLWTGAAAKQKIKTHLKYIFQFNCDLHL